MGLWKRRISWGWIGLVAGILFFTEPAHGVTKAGTSAAQFLKIAVGPRAAALAGSFSAIANDASALYWNPAGIAWMPRGSILATHTDWFLDIQHDFFGLVVPISTASRLGFSFTTLNTSDMEQTTIEEPEGNGIYFDVQDIAVGISFSRMMTNRFSFGITVKYIQQTLFNESAHTVAVDLGGMLKTGFKGMKLGMSMSNFGGKMKLDGRDLIVSYDPSPGQTGNPLVPSRMETESWHLPSNFRIGLALDVVGAREGLFVQPGQRLTISVDGNNFNDSPENLSFGMEYAWNEMFFLRGGYKLNHDLESFSAGLGFQLPFQRWKIQADYAMTGMSNLGMVQRIGLGIGF